jgi:RNA polymerase sigma factor for flagellar operon FliA
LAAAAYCFPVETVTADERERLIVEHLPQVRLIARRIHERLPATVSFDDLISAGVVGLIGAIDNFDSRQNVKLKTYAEFRIRGAILDSLREGDWAPRLKRRLARDMEDAVARAEHRLGRPPEEAEIAAELRIPLDQYRQRLGEVAALDIGELDYSVSAGVASDRAGIVAYIASREEDSPAVQLERAELERLIAKAIDGIPKIERTILSLYFFEEMTLKEIGEIMDLHFTRVSQLKSQAILRLRNAIASRWPSARTERFR